MLLIYVGKTSYNLGCWTFRASDGPCNACATNASAWCVCLLSTPPTKCTILCCLRDLAPGKGLCFAAAPAEWPGETAADQQPLADHLQHQTGSHSAPVNYLRNKGDIVGGLR